MARLSKRSICLMILIGLGLLVAGRGMVAARKPAPPDDVGAGVGVERWVEVFQPSVLNSAQRRAELLWFRDASRGLRGVTVTALAEDIQTHYYESRVLAKAFEEITGIRVEQKIVPEGELVPQILRQIETGAHLYDIYVNDADLIGWHLRTQRVVNLTQYMRGAGRQYTDPYLDLNDWLNLDWGRDYDGNLLQLIDQQFACLYWFRYDWFERKDIKALFRRRYGYELGVPLNWEAYEDIAEFFATTRIDGKRVYGHTDFGKPSPSLGWIFTDQWMCMAGVGDRGLPNGQPVDEWGIRVEHRIPVGSSVSRGGEINGPAAVYALSTYLKWLRKYAPPEAMDWEWGTEGAQCARGDIAQKLFIYITFLSDARFHTAGSPVCDKHGLPLWRVAPCPHGAYWREGMKVGYSDPGAWTIPIDTVGKQRAAAWLWAQFCVSKTVDLKRFLVGGTVIRRSTIFSDYLTRHKAEYGGIIEFYRSPDERKWTPTGRNVPCYPRMTAMWWPNLAKAVTGEYTPQQAMDAIARQQDAFMAELRLSRYSPALNPERSVRDWLYSHPADVAPKPPRPPQKPRTIAYDDLIRQWRQ